MNDCEILIAMMSGPEQANRNYKKWQHAQTMQYKIICNR